MQAFDDASAARLDAEVRWPQVADAVARLPDGERDALLLYAWEDLTYDQIATALDVPEARNTFDDHVLAWLRCGDGVVMISAANTDIHQIASPRTRGGTTVMIVVHVDDVDAHYERAVGEGAEITTALGDTFYGERRYEVTDLEGHRWHIGERHEHIRARGGSVAD